MTIQTQRPTKGDFVVGHQAAAFFPGDLPAVIGRIVATTKSGHEVTFEVHAVLGALGLPKRTVWSWRPMVGAYQQKGVQTQNNCGLALISQAKRKAA